MMPQVPAIKKKYEEYKNYKVSKKKCQRLKNFIKKKHKVVYSRV